jgi:hypothetical protein
MDAAVRVGGLGLALSLVFGVGSEAAEAARKPISGRLSQPGYTVIALAADGRATSAAARRGKFRLRPRVESVTLHLRGPDGVYAGPVVIRGRGRRALLGVREGARLGRIAVRTGYARPTRRVASRWVDATRVARARRGVPIGARVFGRVRYRAARARVPGDRDRDGIPNPLDVDDDGDLILDSFDRPGTARASQTPGAPGDFVNSGLSLGLHNTVNANAAALSAAQVDAALAGNGSLKLNAQHESWPPGATVEVDCGYPQSRTDPNVGGLVYCSRGGTGRVPQPGVPPSDWSRFPDDFDSDGDGFGTVQPDAGGAMVLAPGATTAEIGTGDVLIFRVATGSGETQSLGALEFVFATVPALVSYDDGQGNAATLAYPMTPGPASKELPVAARPNGDVIVTLTFWRPQRRPIPPEPGGWVDIGRLFYAAQPREADAAQCPPRTLSERDPNLARGPGPGDEPFDPSIGGFTDLAPDRPASPANTFTYTLNLTQCLASSGISFNSGESRTFAFGGGALGGSADQTVSFRRQ